MKENRYTYIDIAKGILILVVIFHHISFAAKEMNVSGSLAWNFRLLPLYASWFMPAFFFITGYCSNFEKNFIQFITTNLRTLLWPALTSFLITATYSIMLSHDVNTFMEALNTIPIRGFNWFLMALFLSKMLFWTLNHNISNKTAFGVAIITIACIAIIFNDINFLGANWFHHRHALYLTLFLYLGHLAKVNNLVQKKYLIIASLIFIITVLSCMKIKGVSPGIAGLWINFTITEVPLHILLALTGISFVLLTSIIISNCKILEQIGKDSLIYYIFHIDVIRTIIVFICKYIVTPSDIVSVICTDIITVFLTTVICWAIAYLFKNTILFRIIKL